MYFNNIKYYFTAQDLKFSDLISISSLFVFRLVASEADKHAEGDE